MLPAFVKFHTAAHIHLCTGYCCFHTTTLKVSSWHRDHMATKSLLTWPFIEKTCVLIQIVKKRKIYLYFAFTGLERKWHQFSLPSSLGWVHLVADLVSLSLYQGS